MFEGIKERAALAGKNALIAELTKQRSENWERIHSLEIEAAKQRGKTDYWKQEAEAAREQRNAALRRFRRATRMSD